jgi:serine protease Do
MFKRGNLSRLLAASLLVTVGFIGGLALTAGGDQTAMLAVPVATAAAHNDLDPADVAELTMPAVVNINTNKVVERQQHPFQNDPFFRRFFDIPEHQERLERSLGSGVVISEDGYIVTNNHVVENAESIRVSFNDNETYEAEIIGTDPMTDVALIKIEPDRKLPFLDFGDSDQLRVGERVMAVGNPFGVGQTVTMGIVSAKGRAIGLMQYEDHIQTDASINPGNSGGALVNMRGEVMGINSAILSRSGGSQGIGFAIPANMVQRILTSLREDGSVTRAWLGVQVQEVNQAIADYYQLDKPMGVMVARVTEDAPAEEAGLEEGDIIMSVDGKRVDSVSQLRNTVSLLPVGHKAKLELQREGKQIEKTVKLGELPAQEQLASNRGSGPEDNDGIEGVTVRALNDQLRAHASVPDDIDGLLVTDVDNRSAAAREGLADGDVILEVNRRDVTSLDDYREAVSESEDRPVLLRVYRPRVEGRLFLAIPR